MLLKTGEQFLENAGLEDKLRVLGIDARYEFYQFATVFIAISASATPKEPRNTYEP